MSKKMKALTHPELFIGIAGAIGVDINAIADEIERSLADVGYDTIPISVTAKMFNYPASEVTQNGPDYYSEMNYKMDYANRLCEEFHAPDTLMRIAMAHIAQMRIITSEKSTSKKKLKKKERSSKGDDANDNPVLPNTAYLVRQLKRPDEVALMRKIYGKQFILVSAYGTEEDRLKQLEKKISGSLPVSTTTTKITHKANKLMARDADEGKSDNVQHLRDTFHLADVFVDGINKNQMKIGIERFFQSFFGRADIGPTKTEYGMYLAKSASLRSCDLSRQVGAAIFEETGEIISQGCNEVPKAFGGTYWDDEEPDFRDIKIGHDPNDALKRDVLRDVFERLEKANLLNKRFEKIGSKNEVLQVLLGKSDKQKDKKYYGCLADSQINDLTEYGRVVHAEMSAICDASRLGKKLKNGILYCTTFPCHNCTKHILAAGIKSVVYIEPYPKSRAKHLHSNEIELEKTSETRVSFLPFLGISPFRYRDIFQKGSRKVSGRAKKWYYGEPRPTIEVGVPAYLDSELVEIGQLGGSIQPKQR